LAGVFFFGAVDLRLSPRRGLRWLLMPRPAILLFRPS
jgi:hypothetical protein